MGKKLATLLGRELCAMEFPADRLNATGTGVEEAPPSFAQRLPAPASSISAAHAKRSSPWSRSIHSVQPRTSLVRLNQSRIRFHTSGAPS